MPINEATLTSSQLVFVDVNNNDTLSTENLIISKENVRICKTKKSVL